MSQKGLSSEFNVGEIWDFLKIPADEPVQRKAVQFVYMTMIESGDYSSHPSTNRYLAKEAAIEKIEIRLDLFRQHEKSFFSEKDYHRDPLILAVLCNDFIINANVYIQSAATDEISGRRQDFDEDIIDLANDIWDEALSMHLFSDSESFSYRESLFLCHINTITDLEEALECFPAYTYEDLKKLVKEDIPLWTRLSEENSSIGTVIQEKLEKFKSLLDRDFFREKSKDCLNKNLAIPLPANDI